MSARRRVWIYVVVAAVAIGVSATLTALPLTSVRREVNRTHAADLDLRDITTMRTTLADWQLFFQPVAVLLTGPAPRLVALDVATGSAFIDTEAVQARAMMDVDKGNVIALADHHGDEEAMQMVEIG